MENLMHVPIRSIWVFHAAARAWKHQPGGRAARRDALGGEPADSFPRGSARSYADEQDGASCRPDRGGRAVLRDDHRSDRGDRGGDRDHQGLSVRHDADRAGHAHAFREMASAAPSEDSSTCIPIWSSGSTEPTSRPTSIESWSTSRSGTAMAAGRDCSSKAWRRRLSCRPAHQTMRGREASRSRTCRTIGSFTRPSRRRNGRAGSRSPGSRPQRRWRRILFDRSHMAIDAAAGGMGVALESTMMMRGELESGRLVCPVLSASAAAHRHAVDRLPARPPAAKAGPRVPGLAPKRARQLGRAGEARRRLIIRLPGSAFPSPCGVRRRPDPSSARRPRSSRSGPCGRGAGGEHCAPGPLEGR